MLANECAQMPFGQFNLHGYRTCPVTSTDNLKGGQYLHAKISRGVALNGTLAGKEHREMWQDAFLETLSFYWPGLA